MPTNWAPCFHFWPSPIHFPHRGQKGLLKCGRVLLFTCLKPTEELLLCFKVNPNLRPCPSKHSLAFLCSPFQTHFRSPNLISALQTEIILSEPQIQLSLFSLQTSTAFVLECSALPLCVTGSRSSFRSQLKCHPLSEPSLTVPLVFFIPASLLHRNSPFEKTLNDLFAHLLPAYDSSMRKELGLFCLSPYTQGILTPSTYYIIIIVSPNCIITMH